MNFRVSQLKEIKGMLKLGRPALMPSPPLATIKDLTVSVSIPPNITIKETTIMAVKAAGIFLVSIGRKTIIAIVRVTRPIIYIIS